jgi:NitT/TauT family transport system substrate-binding protein
VGWVLWPGYYPLLIAEQKGFFQKHDLEVQLILYSTTGEETAAVTSGMLDGGTVALNDALLDAMAKNVKVVLITDNSDGGDQIVATQDVVTIEDVVQKNIGAKRGSFGEFLVREMLSQKGIPPSEVTFINVDPENVSGAIPQYISLGHTYEPFTAEALAKGYKVIFSSADTPGLLVNAIAFRRKAIEERPEDIKAFIAAWFEAVQYWQDHPEESNELIAKATGQETEDISLEGVKLFDLSANLNAFKPGTDTSSVYYTARKVSKFLLDSGFVAEPVDVNDVLDNSFLR